MARWTFYDPITATTEAFVINPSEGGTPAFSKKMTYETTTAPNGQTIAFEGREDAQMFEFSGTILEQAEYMMFLGWYQLRHQIQVTDDLGRTFWIYITSFQPKRERAVHYPWKHSYTISAVILDVP